MKIRIGDFHEADKKYVESATLFDIGISGEKAAESPLEVAFQLKPQAGNLLLTGHLRADFKTQCHRCLAGTELVLETEFSTRIIVDAEADVSDDDEALVLPALGTELDLAPFLREIVQLEIPAKILCHDECKGLCPQCGTDLNRKSCQCETDEVDDRWAALKEIKKRLK